MFPSSFHQLAALDLRARFLIGKRLPRPGKPAYGGNLVFFSRKKGIFSPSPETVSEFVFWPFDRLRANG
jgi:hypothetical protein